MTPEDQALQKIVAALGSAGIPYMLAGSIGSSFHGEPRTTNDADIVIAPSRNQLLRFIRSLGPDYYYDENMAMSALEREDMFHVLDLNVMHKTDMILLKKRPYNLEEFKRRIIVSYAGLRVFMISAEDSILTKLEWSKMGESERQFRDALGVAGVQWDSLDKQYLRKWALELGVEDLLNQLEKDLGKQ